MAPLRFRKITAGDPAQGILACASQIPQMQPVGDEGDEREHRQRLITGSLCAFRDLKKNSGDLGFTDVGAFNLPTTDATVTGPYATLELVGYACDTLAPSREDQPHGAFAVEGMVTLAIHPSDLSEIRPGEDIAYYPPFKSSIPPQPIVNAPHVGYGSNTTIQTLRIKTVPANITPASFSASVARGTSAFSGLQWYEHLTKIPIGRVFKKDEKNNCVCVLLNTHQLIEHDRFLSTVYSSAWMPISTGGSAAPIAISTPLGVRIPTINWGSDNIFGAYNRIAASLSARIYAKRLYNGGSVLDPTISAAPSLFAAYAFFSDPAAWAKLSAGLDNEAKNKLLASRKAKLEKAIQELNAIKAKRDAELIAAPRGAVGPYSAAVGSVNSDLRRTRAVLTFVESKITPAAPTSARSVRRPPTAAAADFSDLDITTLPPPVGDGASDEPTADFRDLDITTLPPPGGDVAPDEPTADFRDLDITTLPPPVGDGASDEPTADFRDLDITTLPPPGGDVAPDEPSAVRRVRGRGAPAAARPPSSVNDVAAQPVLNQSLADAIRNQRRTLKKTKRNVSSNPSDGESRTAQSALLETVNAVSEKMNQNNTTDTGDSTSQDWSVTVEQTFKEFEDSSGASNTRIGTALEALKEGVEVATTQIRQKAFLAVTKTSREAQEYYVSAINSIDDIRRELKDAKQSAKRWGVDIDVLQEKAKGMGVSINELSRPEDLTLSEDDYKIVIETILTIERFITNAAKQFEVTENNPTPEALGYLQKIETIKKDADEEVEKNRKAADEEVEENQEAASKSAQKTVQVLSDESKFNGFVKSLSLDSRTKREKADFFNKKERLTELEQIESIFLAYTMLKDVSDSLDLDLEKKEALADSIQAVLGFTPNGKKVYDGEFSFEVDDDDIDKLTVIDGKTFYGQFKNKRDMNLDEFKKKIKFMVEKANDVAGDDAVTAGRFIDITEVSTKRKMADKDSTKTAKRRKSDEAAKKNARPSDRRKRKERV